MSPDRQLSHDDRARLLTCTTSDGYKILHQIMRTEVDKFVVQLINADPSNQQEVISSHLLAKAAAQFYQAVTDRVNEEITQYMAAPRKTDKPIDVTDGLLDLGDIASALDVLPNLFGGE